MSLLARATFRRTISVRLSRGTASASASASSSEPRSSRPSKPHSSEPAQNVASACPAGTVLTGLNYLKGEPPVLAKPDEDYPAWLWELTKPRTLVDDGPGGMAEKRRLRLQHRQTLKDSNMFKAK